MVKKVNAKFWWRGLLLLFFYLSSIEMHIGNNLFLNNSYGSLLSNDIATSRDKFNSNCLANLQFNRDFAIVGNC